VVVSTQLQHTEEALVLHGGGVGLVNNFEVEAVEMVFDLVNVVSEGVRLMTWANGRRRGDVLELREGDGLRAESV
jgi:hypothetical protein